ncbi:unnamed protein product [Psylliodes chrysocephalus]|uniref:Cytochrome P450 n=1 Tax=Psylliodes chrysocephalus TaxID=3402493 RepID=A0A9P0DC31_9CUCU|nr:unnamed protein product [Psylliodes chrysocephala]
MVLLLILLGLVGALVFYYYGIRPMSYWKKRGVKQTTPNWWFGDMRKTTFREENFVDFFQRIYNMEPNSRYFGYYQFSVPTLLIKDPKLIKRITLKEFDHFTDHIQFVPPESDPLWARNLLSLQGQQWKEMRPIISPSFTSNKMKTMFTLMDDCAKNFVNYLLNKNQDIVEVEMKNVATRFANDVIATTAFGVQVDSLEEPNNEFYKMGAQVTDFSSLRKALQFTRATVFPGSTKISKVYIFENPSRQFFIDLIENNLKLREEKGIVRQDMLHLLLEAKNGQKKKGGLEITNVDIIAEALIFFFAGFESVSTLITFTAYELALHPEIQERLRNEIIEASQECNGKCNYDAIIQMKYLDMVISESLRKWTNFPNTNRVCTKDFVIEPELPGEKRVVIEKGTHLELPILALHYDPKYFSNPERFDPERFSDENKDKIDPYTFFPFGLGPRLCIGSRFALMEVKVLLAHLLSSFEIIPIKKTQIPMKLSKKSFSVDPADGVYLGFKRLRL